MDCKLRKAYAETMYVYAIIRYVIFIPIQPCNIKFNELQYEKENDKFVSITETYWNINTSYSHYYALHIQGCAQV